MTSNERGNKFMEDINRKFEKAYKLKPGTCCRQKKTRSGDLVLPKEIPYFCECKAGYPWEYKHFFKMPVKNTLYKKWEQQLIWDWLAYDIERQTIPILIFTKPNEPVLCALPLHVSYCAWRAKNAPFLETDKFDLIGFHVCNFDDFVEENRYSMASFRKNESLQFARYYEHLQKVKK